MIATVGRKTGRIILWNGSNLESIFALGNSQSFGDILGIVVNESSLSSCFTQITYGKNRKSFTGQLNSSLFVVRKANGLISVMGMNEELFRVMGNIRVNDNKRPENCYKIEFLVICGNLFGMYGGVGGTQLHLLKIG